MIIFLYGPDDYRRGERKKFYLGEFRKKYSNLGVGSFDLAEEDGLEKFTEFARSGSLFETSKLALLENIYETDGKKLKESLAGIADKKPTIVLCSESGKPGSELKFLLDTEKPSRAEDFPLLEGYKWENFAAAEARKLNVALAPDALRFLADVHKGNSWSLVTELQKLAVLKKGVIERRDLDKLGLEASPDYWLLLGGLRDGDMKRRLSVLEKLFELREPMPKVFNILASQWREKTPRMAAYDLSVKSGKLDYEEVLLDLAIS